MKINKLMFALLAGAMMASCSDRNDEPVGPDPDAVGSTGYIGISIGMPSQTVARGANDNFDDGLPTEYIVKNVALLFFTGPEASAKFYKAYDVPNGEWNTVGSNNQITQNRVVTFPVDFAKDTEEQLWALAVVNPGSILTVGNNYSLLVDGTPFTGTFKEFLALVTDKPLTGSNGFFMTNAPHSSVPGTLPIGSTAQTNGRFRVLSLVNKDRICATAEAARELPAAAIFVERAVAKVEVDASGLGVAQGAINWPNDPDENVVFKVYDTDWALDNMEPTTYLVRNLCADYNGTNTPYWAYYNTNSTQLTLTHHYRFLGNIGFGHTLWPNTPDPTEHYRTYFCVDPHGVGINEGDEPLVAGTNFTSTGSAYPQYCRENTFDVEHMDYRNTTRAIIKVQFTDNGNLYTIGEDKKNVYYFEDAASYLTFAVLNNHNVADAWIKHFEAKGVEYNNEATNEGLVYSHANHNAINKWMTVWFTCDDTVGRLKISSIDLKDGEGNPVAFDADKAKETIDAINESVTIKYYKDGVAYYAVRIRHFGNDLAPWTAPDNTTNTTTESYGKTNGAIGPQDIQNYLGRYGVVRNNWYVLTLSSINQMGEPVVGDLPLDGTPDDRVLKEESISCRINILSWAKRNQSDEL